MLGTKTLQRWTGKVPIRVLGKGHTRHYSKVFSRPLLQTCRPPACSLVPTRLQQAVHRPIAVRFVFWNLAPNGNAVLFFIEYLVLLDSSM